MTVTPNQSAGNVADVMTEEGVGSVVVEEDDRPVGIVTDRDLVMKVIEPRADPAELTARDVMTEPPTTASKGQGILEATGMMYEHAVRRMPVVDDDGFLYGIVTLDDFLVLLTDELDNLSGVVEAESPPY
jgi:CBS domain-containing protein